MQVTSIDEAKMLKLVNSIRPQEKKKHTFASPLSSKEEEGYRRKIFKATNSKNNDDDDINESPKQSPKASPTLKTPKFDPNMSTDTLDDEEFEKMTNIEKILYKIKHQLEIVDLYTANDKNDHYNITNDITNDDATKTDKICTKLRWTSPHSPHTNNISFERTDNIDMMIIDMKINTKEVKKKITTQESKETLYKLCDQEFN